MRSTSVEIYMLWKPTITNKPVSETIPFSSLHSSNTHYFILCTRQEPSPPVDNPFTLKQCNGE